MKLKEKLLLGGIGGLTPVLAQLILLDFNKIQSWIEYINTPVILGWALLLGYSLKVIALFLIGCLWAYMHESETEKFKIFQLGIVAPAMISALITGSSHVNSDIEVKPTTAFFDFSIISTAMADEVSPNKIKNKSTLIFERIVEGVQAKDVVYEVTNKEIYENKINILKREIRKKDDALNKQNAQNNEIDENNYDFNDLKKSSVKEPLYNVKCKEEIDRCMQDLLICNNRKNSSNECFNSEAKSYEYYSPYLSNTTDSLKKLMTISILSGAMRYPELIKIYRKDYDIDIASLLESIIKSLPYQYPYMKEVNALSDIQERCSMNEKYVTNDYGIDEFMYKPENYKYSSRKLMDEYQMLSACSYSLSKILFLQTSIILSDMEIITN